jgi:tetratricopeptide (TPR) repeat protein
MVFKSDDSFKPFKPLYNGKPANVAGYFHPGRDENMIALNLGANNNEQRPMAVIFHEYTHLLTSVTQREWPIWLKEGLAEAYSSFDVDDNKVTLGAPIASHVYLLREKSLIPLQTLFSVHFNSAEYNERNKQSIFYAESWALVHYLLYGDKTARRPQLNQFIKMIESGVEPQRAFQEAFKTDYATIEKALRDYVGRSSYSVVEYKLQSTEGEKDISIRPVSDAEAQGYLGNLLMRTNRLDEAEVYFKQALAMDSSLARPYEGLGFIAMRRDKYDQAIEYFKQAAEHDSKNFLAHFYYAAAIGRRHQSRSRKEDCREFEAINHTQPAIRPFTLPAWLSLFSDGR